ncbi:MAG: carbamoyltransferase HypF [Gammaproteobacteria bacterium]
MAAAPLAATASCVRRVRVELSGVLQGVGFRPFVSDLARTVGIRGWVANSGSGVTLDAEGEPAAVAAFVARLSTQLPPRARIETLARTDGEPLGHTTFRIRDSIAGTAGPSAFVTPDLAACAECVTEIFDPSDRRFHYPFTSCTHCGPRFSILEALPFDRANTTMRSFELCPACRAEYEDPDNRRFHAQTNACPDCGPRVWLTDPAGHTLSEHTAAIAAAAAALRDGRVLALKGLGGFQLLVDACNDGAVAALRERKQRPAKPFAVMAPGLGWAERHCAVAARERELLCAAEAPIVLLRRRAARKGAASAVAGAVAPQNPLLGVMLPTTPLHHLLLAEFAGPIVATSGNVADEPLVADNACARERLHGVADLWLMHDRDITWALDDSVVRVVADRPLLLRMARGYAPQSVALAAPSAPALALGGQLKSAIGVTLSDRIVVGPYIGALHTPRARRRFHHHVDDLCALHGIRPVMVACDEHPDYYTTQVAEAQAGEHVRVQHHLAHVLACVADNGVTGPVLGVAFDGTGYGTDGTVWGGEFLHVADTAVQRVAHLRSFALPGGDHAIAEPRRAAAGLLFELFGASVFDECRFAPLASFPAAARRIIGQMLARGVNSPRTSSIGRLFDAVAALLDLVQCSGYEGHAAMALEFALDDAPVTACYPLPIVDNAGSTLLDWAPLLHALIADHRRGATVAHMAGAFHNAIATAIVAVAERTGERQVVLSGGCFQNRYLCEQTIKQLRAAGFAVYWHRHVPPNDGGLALGQAVWTARRLRAGAT